MSLFYKLGSTMFTVDFLFWMQASPRTVIHLIWLVKIFNFHTTTAMICAGGLVVTLWHHRDPEVTPWWHHCDPAVTPLRPAYDITVGWKKSSIKSLWAFGWDHTHPHTQSNQDGHYSSRRREFSMIRPALIGGHFLSVFPPQSIGMASPQLVTPGLWAHGFLLPLIPLWWVIWPRPWPGGREWRWPGVPFHGHTGTRAVCRWINKWECSPFVLIFF